ncbi:MAG TPA: undecaprenyl-diphosphatase [Firmicutes bacterium]|nr:undecaprenyl-diphosphatase [Bacillota bacterium]
MSLIEAFFLGLIQGFTEFLPVSSSGHLVLLQYFIGVKMPGITFEVITHAGTLLSIVWVFWQDIYSLIKGITNSARQQKLFLLLLAASLPAGFMGVFFISFFKGIFEKPQVVGLMLLCTGFIVFFIARLERVQGNRTLGEMKGKDAFIIGLFQAFAIIPGISRSGSTIFGALLQGLNRETAVRFSFLLALPAIAGATVLELFNWLKIGSWPENYLVYIIGAIVSFISGILAIRIFIRLLAGGKFYYFAYYCWLVGIFTILYLFLKSPV